MPFESFAEARGGSSAAPSAEVRRGSSAAPSAEVRRGSLAAPSAEVRRGSSVAPYAEVRRSSSTASSAEVRRGSSTAPYAEARRGSSVALFTAVQRGSSAELRWNLRLCLLLLVIVILAGCGRTLTEVDPCATTVCTCVFNTDCPDDFVCIDGVCVDRDDLAQCIANGARPEVCNGRDDDCDGRIDEALADRPCTREVDGLSCPGTEICAGEAGFVCDAPVPSAEICDGIDNDCNGLVDELFVDDRGEYTTLSNCGACGIDCTQTILDADVTACVMTEQGPTCRVIACPPGTFPNSDETACLGLPDALCRPCVDDGDCLGPDSQCLTFRNDERGCGRNCGADSPYGIDCPEGYQCIDEQCRPILDTCLCGPALVGTTRSCRIDACDGFETCESVASGFDWGACDISAWRETCDGADNDCDGVIDNGFLNQQTGRYESDLHCGRCNNDCTARWAPEVDRAIGGCALDGPVPECRIESCTFETIGGIAFEWVDVNGEGDDGCECRRRQGNSTQDDPDLGPLETLTQGVVDQNCDGVDGVVQDALFVRANAPAGGDGTRLRPFQRIQEGLDRLRDTGRRYVLVAEGVYRERVVVPDGAEVYGGYSGDFLRREVLQLATIIQSPVVPGMGPSGSVVLDGVGLTAARTVVSGLYIYGPDANAAAPIGQAGAASIALLVKDSGPGAIVQGNVIRGGRGAAGGRGFDGTDGFGRQRSTAVDGGPGINGERIVGPCRFGTLVEGGAPGVNQQCGSVGGRTGGGAQCPQFDWTSDPVRGTQADFVGPTSGGDGTGGFHRSFDDLSGSGCSHVTESGFPSDFQTHNGSDGRDGIDGTGGTDGRGCTSAIGSFVADEWVSGAGASGLNGAHGQQGGGGGAGGGTARFAQTVDFCNAHEVGATGGGGGAGGCGGSGGVAGGSGGASIAVLLVRGDGFRVFDNRIERGQGGRGGVGGFGGPGGQGGRGGFGGRPNSWSGSTGGKGGDGGNGGSGGGGGGGCGGPSYGVLGFEATVASGVNDFTLADDAPTGGPGGAGGNGALVGFGADGASRNVLQLQRCAADGACPAGALCDVNRVCIPPL